MRENELAILHLACAHSSIRRSAGASILGVSPHSSECRYAFALLVRSGYLVRLPKRGLYAPTPLAIEVSGHCLARRSVAVPIPQSSSDPPVAP